MHLISRGVMSVILCTVFPSEKLVLCCRVIVQVFFILYSTNDICSCHLVLCSLPFCSHPTVLGISNPMILSERLSQVVWISFPVSIQIIWVQATLLAHICFSVLPPCAMLVSIGEDRDIWPGGQLCHTGQNRNPHQFSKLLLSPNAHLYLSSKDHQTDICSANSLQSIALCW